MLFYNILPFIFRYILTFHSINIFKPLGLSCLFKQRKVSLKLYYKGFRAFFKTLCLFNFIFNRSVYGLSFYFFFLFNSLRLKSFFFGIIFKSCFKLFYNRIYAGKLFGCLPLFFSCCLFGLP